MYALPDRQQRVKLKYPNLANENAFVPNGLSQGL